jgi:dicarboxylate transporter 10
MTSDLIRAPEKRYGYRNAVVGVINLVREEKFRGLARGIGPNTVRGFFIFWSSNSYLLFITLRYAQCC